MPFVTTEDGTEVFYKDWGDRQPIVFHHGWPLSADDSDNQMMFFLQHGYRVIAHDRRGRGRSTQTPGGHDMDLSETDFTEDLQAIECPPWSCTATTTRSYRSPMPPHSRSNCSKTAR